MEWEVVECFCLLLICVTGSWKLLLPFLVMYVLQIYTVVHVQPLPSHCYYTDCDLNVSRIHVLLPPSHRLPAVSVYPVMIWDHYTVGFAINGLGWMNSNNLKRVQLRYRPLYTCFGGMQSKSVFPCPLSSFTFYASFPRHHLYTFQIKKDTISTYL